jgi:hypothetical protein
MRLHGSIAALPRLRPSSTLYRDSSARSRCRAHSYKYSNAVASEPRESAVTSEHQPRASVTYLSAGRARWLPSREKRLRLAMRAEAEAGGFTWPISTSLLVNVLP